MSKSFYLNKRTNGPWTSFEQYLLKPENIHVGWIEWIGCKSFRLKKNPFSNHPISEYTYLVPDEVHIPSEEGLIRIIEEKIVKNIKLPIGQIHGQYSDQICVVAGYEPLRTDEIPGPYINKNDFLNRILYNWELGDKKTFGIELAINILSCPKSIYGIGGIGAQSFSPHGSKQHLLTLNKAIQNLLPSDFLKQNKTYQYQAIKTKEDERKINFQVKKAVSNEISYNYLYTLNPEIQKSVMPTQIPVVLPEGFYKRTEWGLDPDVMDYQMGALLIEPQIDERIQERLQKLIKKIGLDILKDIPEEYNVDFQGIIRLTKAWARLQYKWELNEDDFTKMKNDLEEPFKEFFDLVEDTKSIGRTYYAPLTQLTNKTTISIYATRIIKYAKQIERDTEMKRFLKTELRKKIPVKEVSNYDFNTALDELVLTGYLLTYKNGTEYELTLD